jgi:integrase
MRKLKPPAVPDQPVPVIGELQLRRLLAVCAGKDFEARRDTAIILLLIDAGPRRSELADMRLDAVDFEYEVIRVIGKGGRQRALPLGRKTSVALDRYLRVRARHKFAHLDALWLGRRGALTIYGIRELLERRGRQAGIPDLHPHQFRPTFAHERLSMAATRRTSCASPAGGPARCSSATAPPPPTPALERRTAACRRQIACRCRKSEGPRCECCGPSGSPFGQSEPRVLQSSSWCSAR